MVSFGEQCRLNRLATDVYVYIRVRDVARNLKVFATSNKASKANEVRGPTFRANAVAWGIQARADVIRVSVGAVTR